MSESGLPPAINSLSCSTNASMRDRSPAAIDEPRMSTYIDCHVGTRRSFPLSFAEPPASPGGLGAYASATPPGVSSQS